MIALIFLISFVASQEQNAPDSPCPSAFKYDKVKEPGLWTGTLTLFSDSIVHSLWLTVVLDGKANLLGTETGEVSTKDNINYNIENSVLKIYPNQPAEVKFLVRYDVLKKPPKIQEIRFNGKEICNAKFPPPVIDSPNADRGGAVPKTSQRPGPSTTQTWETPVNNQPQQWPAPSGGGVRQPTPAQPEQWPEQPVGGVRQPLPNSIDGPGRAPPSRNSVPDNGYQQTTSVPNNQGTRDCTKEQPGEDYFDGGLPTLTSIANSAPCRNQQNTNTQQNQNNQQDRCGIVTFYNPVPLVIDGKPTSEGQWPWQIALYQYQSINNKYLCGGTLISLRHVTTAAHCVTRQGTNILVNNNTLTIILGKHNLRTSVRGVQTKYVMKINLHPEFNGQYSHDAAILTLDSPVEITDRVRTVCLWPEHLVNLNSVIGRVGTVVGWGVDRNGQSSEQLALVEMPIVDQETCARSHEGGFFIKYTSNFTFCAGYRDGTSVCNGDSGGGMVFNINNAWYLRGLVSLSVSQGKNRCDPAHYVIFTDLAKLLPWIYNVLREY